MSNEAKGKKQKPAAPAVETVETSETAGQTEEATIAGSEIPVGTGAEMVRRVRDVAAVAGEHVVDESLEDAAIATDDEAYYEQLLAKVPEKERKMPGAELFAEACFAYGIDPREKPPEVNILFDQGQPRWKFKPGNPQAGVPDRVKFVTAGGQKIIHPGGTDPEGRDFDRRLRRVFKTLGRNGREGELPDDLTLPRTLVTGIVPKNAPHKPAVGFMRRRAQQAARGQSPQSPRR